MSPSKRHNTLTDMFGSIRSTLLRRVTVMLGNRQEAEDILQDVFVKLWTSDPHETEMTSPSAAFIATSVRNAGIDRLRHRRRHMEENIDTLSDIAPDPSPPPADALEMDDRRRILDRVNTVINLTLSPRDREIMTMHDIHGLSYSRIAAETNLTESNVRLIISRARKTVRQAYLDRFNSNPLEYL